MLLVSDRHLARNIYGVVFHVYKRNGTRVYNVGPSCPGETLVRANACGGPPQGRFHSPAIDNVMAACRRFKLSVDLERDCNRELLRNLNRLYIVQLVVVAWL